MQMGEAEGKDEFARIGGSSALSKITSAGYASLNVRLRVGLGCTRSLIRRSSRITTPAAPTRSGPSLDLPRARLIRDPAHGLFGEASWHPKRLASFSASPLPRMRS